MWCPAHGHEVNAEGLASGIGQACQRKQRAGKRGQKQSRQAHCRASKRNQPTVHAVPLAAEAYLPPASGSDSIYDRMLCKEGKQCDKPNKCNKKHCARRPLSIRTPPAHTPEKEYMGNHKRGWRPASPCWVKLPTSPSEAHSFHER